MQLVCVESATMASDRSRFNEARDKWKRLKRQRELSLAPDVGVTAITLPSTGRLDLTRQEQAQELASFADEAERLAEALRKQGRVVEIARATPLKLELLLKNRDVASIYTVGHGTLATLHCVSTISVAWDTVSQYTDHLKQGEFVQRQCGNQPFSTNVPFGMFAVADMRLLRAAAGYELPEVLSNEHEQLIRPLFSRPGVPSYANIKAWFPSQSVGHEPKLDTGLAVASPIVMY